MTTRWPLKAVVPVLLAAGIAALGAGGSDQSKSSASSQAKPATTTAPATGHEGHTMPATPSKGDPVKGENKTITGEVMDPACFLEAGEKSIGKGHFQCAVDCARSGQTLAIYDRAADLIYFIAGELPGKNPNEPLMAYIHKKVDVTGVVYHRSGAHGIVIRKVVLHVEKPAGAPAAGASAPTK